MIWAPNIVWLDGLRALQGVGAAAALAGGSAALANTFEGRSQTKAFSLLGTSFGVGLALGPILAGVLIEHIGWRAVFVSGALVGGRVVAAEPGGDQSADARMGRPAAGDRQAFQVLLYGLAALTVAVAVLILWFLRQNLVVAAAGCEGVRSTPFP